VNTRTSALDARLKPSRYDDEVGARQLLSDERSAKALAERQRTHPNGAFVAPLMIAVLALGAARPAFAQRANGPYAGLFGGQDTAEQSQGLTLNLSMFGAYDKNSFPPGEASDLIDPRLKESGASAGVTGSLHYDRRGDRGMFMWTGGGTGQEYAASPGAVVAYNTGSSLQLKMRPTLVLDAHAGAAYSPFFQFSPFQAGGPVSAGPPLSGFGFAAVGERNVITDGSIGLTSNFTARSSAYASVDRYDAHLLDNPDNNLSTWGGRAGVRHHLTRALGLHLEYGQQQVNNAATTAPRYAYSTIDAGVDYGDSLTFARRTSLTFSTSTAAVRYNSQTNYRLNGAATLARGLGRSWSAYASYNRDTQFMIGFLQPLLTDSVTTGVSGLMALRTKWSAAGGYTHGSIGFGGSDFTVYSASSRLELALTRSLGLYGQYSYYRYQVPAGSSDLDILTRLSRQTGTVGLTLWVPIINDLRRPNESK
jgi:hypothetical protein